jgi:myosin heavy subunit
MSALIYLDPPNILWNLQKRYEKAEIYTAISKVLVAINPYEMHDVYSGWHINEYRRQAHLRLNTLPPHVFSVAQQAYHQMEITDSNQSMIVCGESGYVCACCVLRACAGPTAGPLVLVT